MLVIDLCPVESWQWCASVNRTVGALCGLPEYRHRQRVHALDVLNDHNKAAEAPALAEQAYDAGADLLMDVQNSPIAGQHFGYPAEVELRYASRGLARDQLARSLKQRRT
jgi:hypothetical protein